MQDAIIKGTGNSRKLKSVANFLTLYPTYADFAAALVAGTLPIDLNGINASGYDTVGTPINKATLLTDETAALMELSGADATPEKAFEWLSNMATKSINPTALGGGSKIHLVGEVVSVPDSSPVDIFKFKVVRGGTIRVYASKEATPGSGESTTSVVNYYVNGTLSDSKNIPNGSSSTSVYCDLALSLGDIVRVEFVSAASWTLSVHGEAEGYVVEDTEYYLQEVE